MKSTLSILLCLLTFSFGFAQKKVKVKGNKIVVADQHTVESFHTIDASDNVEILLSESSDPMIEVEADSNLHAFVKFIVNDGILKIKTTRDIRRSKKLALKIKYPNTLKNIIIRDEVTLKASGPIIGAAITLETNDYSKSFVTIESESVHFTSNGKSKNELHIKTSLAKLQINDNTELTGILTTNEAAIDLYTKSTAKLEGEAKNLTLRAEGNTNFYGEKLETTSTKILAENDTDVYVLVHGNVDISAIDKSEVYLMGQPKITITSFDNESILYKKEEGYSPGFFN